ncbi:hypothetical protein HPB48_018496 [Haemaphysalis longicornis]|uniref:Uncharacterized protein n=1 Tax=Haemaphysalis longicornis TaxID=44386 RepID=A0A9J6GE60_HAELO|nr:hypothetical protein HPB48_018496 [Haemaphysalis longicornis]
MAFTLMAVFNFFCLLIFVSQIVVVNIISADRCNKFDTYLFLGQPSSDPTHPDHIASVFPYRVHGNLEQKLTRFNRALKKQRLEPALGDSRSPPDDSADQKTTKRT